MVDGTDISEWEVALSKPTSAVFLETPSNPQLDIIDLPTVSAIAHDSGARVIVDNIIATPIFQKPLTLGADVVVYSSTKHIDGQGRAMGGCIITNDNDWANGELNQFLRHTGPAMSPFNAWVHLKGMETLKLRVEQHAKSAQLIAEFLENELNVSRVLFPGLDSHPQRALAKKQMTGPGTVVSFDIAGGISEAFKFLNKLDMIDISNNLGDSKSLITHPATTTHQRLSPESRLNVGITDSMLRLSVGLEDSADIMGDLELALKKI